MQCPNCGKEAINVSGKYVCLDCGVELNPTGTAGGQSQMSPSPSISNHTEPEETNTEEPTPQIIHERSPLSEFPSSAPIPSTPPEPQISQAPEPQVQQTVPEPPIAEPANANVTASEVKPEEPTPIEPVQADTVKDDFLNELSAAGGTGNYDFGQSMQAPANDNPPLEEVAPQTVPIQPEPQEETNEPETFFKPETVDIRPNAEPAQEPPKQEEPSETDNRASETFDAYSTPSGIGVGEPLVGDLESKIVPISPEAITPPTRENKVQEEVKELFVQKEAPTPESAPPVVTPPTGETPAPEAPQPDTSLDDLLNKYSNAPMPNTTTSGPSPSFDTVIPTTSARPSGVSFPQSPMINSYESSTLSPAGAAPQIPGSSTIPSADSVFGPQPDSNSEKLNIPEASAASNKKRIILISAAVGGILVLLIVGIFIFLGISKNRNNNSSTGTDTTQEETFKISEEVSSIMDLPRSMTAEYEQTVDFTAVTTFEAEEEKSLETKKKLDEFIKTPVTTSGTWKTDKNSNVMLEGTASGAAVKKTYIVADKATYINNAASNAWTKTDGDVITEIPIFYAPKSKATLFYNIKVDSIDEVGQETIDGTAYRKMVIKPKADIIEDALSEINPIFSAVNYNSVNLEKLEVLAWVSSDGLIQKMKIAGEIMVESNLYNGPVTINSSVSYKYEDQEIKKPENVTSFNRDFSITKAIINKNTVG